MNTGAAQASASEARGTRIDRGRRPPIGRKSAVRAILWLLCAMALGACGAAQRGPFGYDDSAELDVRVSFSHLDGGVRISELTYASPKGGRVPALLFVPSGRGPFAGLIVQHGLPSKKEDVAFDAEELAGLGAVVIAIDAPFARRSGAPIAFARRDRKEQIQLIVDLRRAVDLLRARADVDDDRIAYLGFSYGAAMGGLLAGIEHRIRAFVLMSGDGGLVEHFSGPEHRSGPLFMLSLARRRAWLAAMRPIEPLRWVKRASAPILFLSGRRDQLVSVRDAVRYQRAAPQPKEIRWYDSDHMLSSQAWCDAAHFLGRQIGIAGSKEPECAY
jgi:dienelactone hydrolase